MAGRLLIDNGATALLSWGCAAGLSEALVPGSLVLPQKLAAADGRLIATDPQWHATMHERLCQRFIVHTAQLVESPYLVRTAAEKAALAARFQGIALDMESAALARVAAEKQIPFAVIRAVVDPAATDLPRSIAHALDDRGEVEQHRLLAYVLRYPSELRALAHVAKCFHAAGQTLRRVAHAIGPSFLVPFHGPQRLNRSAA